MRQEWQNWYYYMKSNDQAGYTPEVADWPPQTISLAFGCRGILSLFLLSGQKYTHNTVNRNGG